MSLHEFWVAAFLAALAGGHNFRGAEEQADQALLIYSERWPDGEEESQCG